MFYYSKKSNRKIIHTAGCSYICKTDSKYLGCFDSLSNAKKYRYCFCKRCNPLKMQYKTEEDRISDFCRKNGFSVKLKKFDISVKTVRSEWKITVNGDEKMVLYHKNDFEKKNDCLSEIKGYHLQGDTAKNSITEYLDYIADHDYFRMLHPVYVPRNKKAASPPRKGTKRYKKAQRRIKKYERKQAIDNVLSLIDSLSKQNVPANAAAV